MEGGVRGAGRVGGGFFMENPRRGGGSPVWVGAGGRGARRVFAGMGGGLNISSEPKFRESAKGRLGVWCGSADKLSSQQVLNVGA